MAVILHVDDNKVWRDLVARTIGAKGHAVFSCSHLAKAKEIYQRYKFELVICDGNVDQENDGLAWAEELHRQGQKTVVLSIDAETKVPFILKGEYKAEDVLAVLKSGSS